MDPDDIRQHITFILYDGIENSVFSSQVLQPLLNLLKENNNLDLTLVSFEKQRPSNKTITNLIPAHEKLHFVLCRKLPFFGKISLRFATFQLKKLFKIIPSGKIICRGPLAGWVAKKALAKHRSFGSTLRYILQGKTLRASEPRTEKNIPKTVRPEPVEGYERFQINITIQARGLCAQEYRFATEELKENFIKKIYRKFVYHKLNQIEQEAFQTKQKLNSSLNITIESVSNALKDYLVNYFGSEKDKINIATKDIPQKIDKEKIQKWRSKIRSKLNIAPDQFVYCYSGSFKPWQCLPEAIDFFEKQHKKNPNSFLLILSQDKKNVETFIGARKIPMQKYALTCAKPDELYKYLAACDAGFLFRDKDIINWVSRPTKMLEYQAVGLEVIHNHTIAYLADQAQT